MLPPIIHSPSDLILLVNCCFGFFLQFDNLNATHETSKLKIEASHSEKIELLKKAYETSLSGKNTFSLLKSSKSSWNSLVCFRTEMIHNFPSRGCTVVFSFGGFLGFLLLVYWEWYMPFPLRRQIRVFCFCFRFL